MLVIAAAILVAAGITGSTIWVRHQYFVSDQGNLVVVFRGVDGSLLGWHFSTFEETSCAGNTNCTPMRVSDLQPAAQNQVRAGIKALNLVDARDVVQRLSGQLLPPCPTTRPGDADASGDAPPARSPETTDRTTTDTTTTSPAPTTKETTAATTRPAAVATTRAADPSRAAAGIVASTLAAANATGPPTSGGQVLAAAATGPGQVAAAQPGHIVIPGEAAPDIDAAAPAGSHAAAANVASDTPATDSTTTIEPVPTAITVTETVTATPLAPAPAVPGVTCRSTQ